MIYKSKYVVKDRQKTLSQETLYQVLCGAVVTEKSTLAREQHCYIFRVASWANKMNIKKAVETIFNVKVEKVNTLVRKGKTMVFRGRRGAHSPVKNAMVSLQKGFSIDLEKGVAS